METLFNVVISSTKGAICHVKTLTEVKIPQKYGLLNVSKYTDKLARVGAGYEPSVNAERQREGVDPNFEAEPLKWGHWFLYPFVVEHKGEFYYRLYDFDGGLIRQTYYVDGEVATAEQTAIIKAWESSRSTSSRQGVAKPVRLTTVKESSILYFKCNTEWCKPSLATAER